MRIEFGNVAPLDNGEPMGFFAVTTAALPPFISLSDAFRAVADTGPSGNGFWAIHSSAAPAWVAVSPDHVDPTDEEAVAVAGVAAQALEMLLSSHFDCARGVPEDVEMHYYTTTPPGVLPGEPAPEGDE